MNNIVIKVIIGIVFLSSISYAELVSANAMNANSNSSSLSKQKEFEKKHPEYVKKMMEKIEGYLNYASSNGKKSLSIFISDTPGYKDIKEYAEFKLFLELKLKSLNYRVKRSNDYIEIYW